MDDRFGAEIKVGDRIAYAAHSYGHNICLRIGTVKSVKEKSLSVLGDGNCSCGNLSDSSRIINLNAHGFKFPKWSTCPPSPN